MAVADAALAGALRQAQKTPMCFAFVAQGSSEGKLLLAKKPIPTPEVAEAKKTVGGGQVFRGRCVGEEGKLVFEVGKEPPATLPRHLKTVITRDAGLNLQVEVRVAPDLAEAEAVPAMGPGASAATAPSPPPPGKAAAPPPSPPPGEAAARFAARLKGLLPNIQRLGASASPLAQSVKTRASEASQLAHKQDFTQANALLDEIESLVKQAPAPPAPATAPPSAVTGAAAGTVAAEVLRLELHKVRLEAVQGIAKLVAKVGTTPHALAPQVVTVLKQLAHDMPADLEGVLQELSAASKAGDTGGVAKQKAAIHQSAKGWLAFLQRNADYIRSCEVNPWKIPVAIDQPIRTSLTAILKVAH
jgi:hypothetical protein